MKKAYKRISCVIMSVVLTISLFTIPAFADNAITVQLNGVSLSFDVAPQMINNRTMVPMRKIFESLGATVEWDSNSQTITATKGITKIIMQINKNDMKKNDQTITLDVPPQIVDSRTLVPVRAVAESFDANVKWDSEKQVVSITTTESSAGTSTGESTNTSEETDTQNSNTTYYFSEVLDTKFISAKDGKWNIAIPSSYDTVSSSAGNEIFKNSATNEMMYVQIRSLAGNTETLQEIAKEQLKTRIDSSDTKVTHAIFKDVTEEKINNLDYYTFTIKSTLNSSTDSYYSICYFTIYDGLLFEFGDYPPDGTMSKVFKDTLNAFPDFNALD